LQTGDSKKANRMRAINFRPDNTWRFALALLPFAFLVFAYIIGSGVRLADNPNDKLLPAFSKMGEAVDAYAFKPDARTGDYLLWEDTTASMTRLVTGLAISTSIALVLGIVIGLLPVAGATLGPVVSVLSMVPPLALLPILFIVMGLGEASKITLLVVGTSLKLIRDIALRVEDIPREQLIKAQTLGASSMQIALRVILPQTLPRLIDSVRLEIGPAWLFLIAAEAIAADSGLGYRIFLVRRYLSMDVILPYVAWITLLAFLMDLGLRILQRKAFPWFAKARAA
jgi:NitT/TauT family transport system permease protein